MNNKLIDPAKLAALKQKYNERYQDPETAKAFLAQTEVDEVVRLAKANGYKLEDILRDIKEACSMDPRAAKVSEAVLARHLRTARGASPKESASGPRDKKSQKAGTSKGPGALLPGGTERTATPPASVSSVEAHKTV